MYPRQQAAAEAEQADPEKHSVKRGKADARLLAAAVGAPASCVHVFDLPSSSLLASPAVRGSVEQVQWSADGRALQDGHGDVFNAP